MKILFISNDAGQLGAPLSLYIIIRHIIQAIGSVDVRILLRIGRGELLVPFQELATTYIFTKDESDLKIKYLNEKQKLIQAELVSWSPDLIYSNTSLNGDILHYLDLNKYRLLTHVRELGWYLESLNELQTDSLVNNTLIYFAASEAVKKYLCEQLNIPQQKIDVIPPCISIKDISTKKDSPLDKEIDQWIKLSKSPIIGVVGRCDKRKGSDIFFRVASQLIERKNDVRFLWVGHGPDLNWLVENFRRIANDDIFLATGFLKNPYNVMKHINVLFTPSRDDPFPRVNIEAGSLGIPVVAFRESGGSKEFIQKDCGLIIEDFSEKKASMELERLILNQSLIKHFGSNAKKLAKESFDETFVAENIFNIIKGFIND